MIDQGRRQLIDVRVRTDWYELAQQKLLGYTRRWREIKGLTIVATLLVFVATFLLPSWPWQYSLRTVFSCALLMGFSLWQPHPLEGPDRWALPVLSGLACVMILVARYTAPLAVEGQAGARISAWPIALVALVPFLAGMLLVWTFRRHPARMRSLGISSAGWLPNLVLGATAGGGLGLHFLLTAYFVPDSGLLSGASWQVAIWALAYEAGLRSLGEELFFRGVAFPVLSEGLQLGFWSAAAWVTFLNVLIYSVPTSQGPSLSLWVLVLVYRTILSILNVFLRYRQGNLISCLACSVVFGVIVSTATGA